MNSSPAPKDLTGLPLGKSVSYSNKYDPTILFKIGRQQSSLVQNYPGVDIWRCYEFTCLLQNGFPLNYGLQIYVPSDSRFIVESKSLKLYLGSFASEKFSSIADCLDTIKTDLKKLLGIDSLLIKVLELKSPDSWSTAALPGICIDDINIECKIFDSPSKALIETEVAASDRQILHTNIFRSLCPVTEQPDYASIIIKYNGAKIKTDSLLRYSVSFRKHSGFHESCCEKIFEDLLSSAKFEDLSVGCFFTRRGGIEINPVRSTHSIKFEDWDFRSIRQ